MKTQISICWFRRDLRADDHAALFYALTGPAPVLPLFIFDREILDQLPSKKDRRVAFIRQALLQLEDTFNKAASSLCVMHDTAIKAFQKLVTQFDIKDVYTNHDYEPSAIKRDEAIRAFLASKNIRFHTYKDQVIFEKNEILKPDATPYTLFTPYANAWKQKFLNGTLPGYSTTSQLNNLVKLPPSPVPSLQEIGFEDIDTISPVPFMDETIVRNYSKTRDLPGLEGTSHLSPHLRFGTISVRKAVRTANGLNQQWLNELIWREFFMMILFKFPHVVHQSFKVKYDQIKWRNNEKEFELWCKGETGYPLVDAGMRQLNQTGWMHNRVRMITASFLTKHLLIDWRWGEAYFAEKLLDYDLSSNNGNWQWAAGSGCDAAPYFRIFNPLLQQKKFDPDLRYIKTWIPGFHEHYLPMVVEHEFARKRALQVYKASLEQ